MTLVIPTGYAQCSIKMQHANLARAAYCTWGIDVSSAGGDFQGAVDDVRSAWAGSVHLQMDSSVTIGPVTARVGSDSGEHLVYVDTIAPAVGGASGTVTPPSIAALIHKRTARGGRRGRGRMFLPWALSAAVVDEVGVVSSSRITSLNTAFASFLTALSGAGVPMVLLHNVGQTSTGAPNVVTGMTCDNRVGSQRRRQGR